MFVFEGTNEILWNVKNVKNGTEKEGLVLVDKKPVLIYRIS